jgi:hypothetical protein
LSQYDSQEIILSMNQIKPNIKILILVLTAVASFGFFFSRPLMIQDPAYHQFIDTRYFFGIPNAQDVLSNICFIIVGLLGLTEIIKNTTQKSASWIIFFIGIILVAPGSAYYHWSPNNMTLLWDRLPMSIGFMALYIILLSEHISLKCEKLLPWSLLIGFASVITWIITTDLRFYFWIQFSSFITIPMILLLYPSRFTHKKWFGVTLMFYGLAKWAEVKDHAIFELSNNLISGHTLKHILAAMGIAALWWMLKVRKEVLVTAA